MSIIETAYAKINLGLRILGRRPDGYHSLLSIFQTIDLADILELSLSGTPGLSCSAPGVPTGKENLVLKAQELVRTYFTVQEVRFLLDKKIPAGAGLGGGSSDAAASLRGLVRIHHLFWTDESLRAHAAEIGSDVPFFVSGGTAVVSGRGEVIEAVRWPFPFTYVLVYPGFPVSTAWAYRQLGEIGKNTEPYREMIESLKSGRLGKEVFFAALGNDFEEPVFRSYPVLGRIKHQLMENGASAAVMSGSGSTLAGIFENTEAARRCAEVLRSQPGYSVFVARPVGGVG